MKNIKRLFLLLLALILLPAAMSAEAMSAATLEEFQTFLAQSREQNLTSISITVQPDLLEQLKQNNYAQLQTVCRLADMEDYSLRVSQSGTITFNDVVYGDLNAVVCETLEDVKAALNQNISEQSAQFELHCPQELFQSLFTQGGMSRLMYEHGIGDFTMRGNTRGQIFLSELKPFTVPYAQVSTINEAGEKISAWREENVEAFNLLFDMDVYQTLTREDYRLIAFLGGLDNYTYSSSNRAGTLFYTEVSYSELPGAYCTSEDEVVNAIRAMGARGITDFQLMLDQPTYDAVYTDYFTRLHELQAQAGMSDSKLSYSGISRLLIFKEAVIDANAVILSEMDDVIAMVDETASHCGSDLSMLLSAELYGDLMDGVSAFFVSDAKFYDLIANAGIMTADDISFNRQSGAINLRGIRYYAGFSILNALENGDVSPLTNREQKALEAARQLAENCKRDTQTETALAIHDALCDLIVYADDETTEEDDCCIGALLNGEANCDGYADAMMLVGRLAGLNIRYQHGDSRNDLFGMFSTHMWNLIELDGTWRMIDLTWDDMENGAIHTWFNIGQDRAAHSHVWSEAMTVPMLAVTDADSRPNAEYFVATGEEATAAAAMAQLAGQTVFDVYFTVEDNSIGQITTREAIRQGLNGSFSYVWLDTFKCMHIQLLP